MQRLIACIPNFSEGRDRAVIDAITAEIAGVEGVKVLDVDPGRATNRTVVTFVGEPEAVLDAAVRAAAKASELIDMASPHGRTPTVRCHGRLSARSRIGRHDGRNGVLRPNRSPDASAMKSVSTVYSYEAAAMKPERVNLADVREGEYEGLGVTPPGCQWAPDAGPDDVQPSIRGDRRRRQGIPRRLQHQSQYDVDASGKCHCIRRSRAREGEAHGGRSHGRSRTRCQRRAGVDSRAP